MVCSPANQLGGTWATVAATGFMDLQISNGTDPDRTIRLSLCIQSCMNHMNKIQFATGHRFHMHYFRLPCSIFQITISHYYISVPSKTQLCISDFGAKLSTPRATFPLRPPIPATNGEFLCLVASTLPGTKKQIYQRSFFRSSSEGHCHTYIHEHIHIHIHILLCIYICVC